MTVAELIEALSVLDPEMEVFTTDNYYGDPHLEVDTVEVVEKKDYSYYPPRSTGEKIVSLH